MTTSALALPLLLVAVSGLQQTQASSPQVPFPELRGPYLGQEPPGAEARVFAPGIVTRDIMSHASPCFSPDGSEVYWSEFQLDPNHLTILWSRIVDGAWSQPVAVSFSSADSYGDDVPFVRPDGRRLYVTSFRDLPELELVDREKIWFTERTATGWSQPRPVAHAVNAGQMHWQLSVSSQGTLFYGTDEGMLLSRLVDGEHQAPERVTNVLHPQYQGLTPFIAPDESYLLFAAEREGGLGKKDLYVGFRREDGTWTPPIHLGPGINSPLHELCPLVSSDGRYLFFTSQRDCEQAGVFWARADFLEALRPREPGR